MSRYNGHKENTDEARRHTRLGIFGAKRNLWALGMMLYVVRRETTVVLYTVTSNNVRMSFDV